MQKLKKNIRESFLNPILHILPLVVFVAVSDFLSTSYSWLIFILLGVASGMYVNYMYPRIIRWFLFSMSLWVVVAATITLIPTDNVPTPYSLIFGEFVTLFFAVVVLLTRKYLERLVFKLTPKNVAMTNNLNEVFRLLTVYSMILFVFINAYSMVYFQGTEYAEYSTSDAIYLIYLIALGAMFAYEFLRVFIIRKHLLKEEWWPVVNEQGRVIGSIQNLESLSDSKKYMHPVVRIILIDRNRILLQKTDTCEFVPSDVWDIPLSTHMRVEESIEKCIARLAREKLSEDKLRTFHLSNLIHETSCESQFVYLFVSCQAEQFELSCELLPGSKWWTLKQIQENNDSGIFSEHFLTEVNLLKRSGLLDSGLCECSCSLKDAVLQNTLISNK